MSAPQKPRPQSAASQSAVSRPRESLAASRLRKHADFQHVYAAAKKRRSKYIIWFVAPRQDATTPRVGLTVGKVIGKAHERNRIKRRMREVLRRHIAELPDGCDLVLHPQRSVLTLEFVKLEAEIVRILHEANAGRMHANSSRPSRSAASAGAAGAAS